MVAAAYRFHLWDRRSGESNSICRKQIQRAGYRLREQRPIYRSINEKWLYACSVDISPEMVSLARQRHPDVAFYAADICTWQFPQTYDLISAWDSTFHLPIAEQEPVLKKMCDGLNVTGVVLFTCGGGTTPQEISGGFAGEPFDYSTLGVNEFLRLIDKFGCTCKHLEYDQHPENHVYIIAQKVK